MLQPIDIAIAYLAGYHSHNGTWAPKLIREDLEVPWSSLHVSIGRLQGAGVFRGGRVSRKSLATLLPALQYLVPARLSKGESVRGVLTGASSPGFAGRLVVSFPVVWACERGSVDGVPMIPLYRTIPNAALNHRRLHTLFGALDAARMGRARELTLAREILTEMVGLPEPVAA